MREFIDPTEFGALAYAFQHGMLPSQSTSEPTINSASGIEAVAASTSALVDYVKQQSKEWLAALDAQIGPPPSYSVADVRHWLDQNFQPHRHLPKLLSVAEAMNDNDWLTVLGEVWTTLPNVTQHKYDLLAKSLLGSMTWNASFPRSWTMTSGKSTPRCLTASPFIAGAASRTRPGFHGPWKTITPLPAIPSIRSSPRNTRCCSVPPLQRAGSRH